MAQTELPTLRVVLRHGIYLQEKKLLEEGVDRRNYSIRQLSVDVTVEVVSCWQRANAQFRPPVIFQDKSIDRKIQVAWTALENFAWNRGGMKREEDRNNFLENLDSLFNITSCSHEILPCSESGCEGCQEGAHLLDCTCRREKRIPKLELGFMMAMKTRRPPGQKASMMMTGPDVKETKRQQKAAERKEKDDKMKKATAEKEKEHQKELDDRRSAEAELLLQEQSTEATDESMAEEEAVMKRNTLKITNTALATIRTEATNRQAAAITSGFVLDLIAAEVLPVGS